MDLHRIKNLLQTEHTLLDHEWKGAVVFLCNEEHVFFIKRSLKMPTHGGQVAFVGGHKKADEHHPSVVAAREYEEETSLTSDTIECLGFLPAVLTANMLPILPVVTKLLISTEEFLARAKSNGEWDAIVAYPWKDLCSESKWEFAWRYGRTKSAMMFHPLPGDHLLWGATAAMVWDLLRLYFKDEASPY